MSGYAQDFSFGVVTDIQYADKDSLLSREFRGSLDKLGKAAAVFNSLDLAFAIQLGDIVDGRANASGNLEDYRKALAAFNAIDAPKRHAVGNHCMTLEKADLLANFASGRFYYDFTSEKAPGWRFIVLDGNDGGTWRMAEPQVAWLAGKLKAAAIAKERVICFCHFPLLNDIALTHRLRDPEELLKAMDGSGADVVAWISGHCHRGGYGVRNGTHHVSVKGMVEAKENAFAVFAVKGSELVESGYGEEPSRVLKLRPSSSR